jgi:WhiB family redox-sensing transcriptional regulator
MLILSSGGGGRAYGVSAGDVMPDSWRDQGPCIEIDPEFFFPEGKLPAAVAQAEKAKAVCRACPVLGQCREFELSATPEGGLRSSDGVFAAMTADERRAELVRRRRRAQRAAATGRTVAA